MWKEKIINIVNGKENNKKNLENLIFLIILLIVTIIIINILLKDNKKNDEENAIDTNYKTLADSKNVSSNDNDLQIQLEKILATIKGVGNVQVFLNYSESSKTIAMYDEKKTTSSIEETDSAGGVRNTVSTELQKDVIFSQKDGNQVPMTEKIVMPTIEGAIITAQGAKNSSVKTDIMNAVKSATGLSIDKIQVFEMQEERNVIEGE